ncbi:MAG: hypothetical protein QXG12_04340 [Thermoproteota archaeon]
MTNSFDINEWRLSRAKGVILEYMRGVKPRATLKWALGCLTKGFGLSKDEALKLIESIRNDPTVILTEDRLRRLEELKKALLLHHVSVLI